MNPDKIIVDEYLLKEFLNLIIQTSQQFTPDIILHMFSKKYIYNFKTKITIQDNEPMFMTKINIFNEKHEELQLDNFTEKIVCCFIHLYTFKLIYENVQLGALIENKLYKKIYLDTQFYMKLIENNSNEETINELNKIVQEVFAYIVNQMKKDI